MILQSERAEELLRHYSSYWGAPKNIISFQNECDNTPNPIYIAVYPPYSRGENWVYATVGMSQLDMHIPDEAVSLNTLSRIELCIYAEREESDIPENLQALALYPFVTHSFLAPQHIIPGNHGIIEKSKISDILFLSPQSEEEAFEIIHHRDSSHTRILWAVPIYRSEHLFLREHGWDALEDIFYQNKTNTSHFRRKPAVY